jgi:hypothetical protein
MGFFSLSKKQQHQNDRTPNSVVQAIRYRFVSAPVEHMYKAQKSPHNALSPHNSTRSTSSKVDHPRTSPQLHLNISRPKSVNPTAQPPTLPHLPHWCWRMQLGISLLLNPDLYRMLSRSFPFLCPFPFKSNSSTYSSPDFPFHKQDDIGAKAQ